LILVLGAGYVGGALAKRALAAGTDVVLADNWYATRREQLAELEARGAKVETADIRDREQVDRLLAESPERVYLLAAQASRPLSEREPDYTEETNVTGARRVAEAVAERRGPMLVYGSSLHVYGPGLTGAVDANRPYGPQSDLAHLSKIYAELCLGLHARRGGFDLAILRLGIVYGPSPVEHERPESQTVVDRFRRLAEAEAELPLDDRGKATIGVVHVEDAARILLESDSGVANVAAETITVADVARLARGEEPADEPAFTVRSPFDYRHTVREYLLP
jgi:nucleoside-diphosphate-sugar epimerase